MNFTIIVAVDENNGIGLNNSIPFYIKDDLKYFKEITTKTYNDIKLNAVIMGYKTYNTLPYKKLQNRLNVVLTNNKDKIFSQDIIVKYSLDDALVYLNNLKIIENVFIIGGSQIYNLAIKSPYCNKILLTKIYGNFNCDTFFPQINNNIFVLYKQSETHNNEKDNVKYKFLEYCKKTL